MNTKTKKIKYPRIASERNTVINLMYLPALLLILVFTVYPFFRGIFLSFTDWNGYSQSYNFVGFNNYVNLFGETDMIVAIRNTLIYGFGCALLQNVFGLSIALLLDQKLRGRNLVRVLVYLPTMISGLIMGYIWYFILRYNGALPEAFSLFGIQVGNLLAKQLGTVFIIVGINSFQAVGTAMIFYQAGLQNVPQDLLEAATIDGAGAWKRFIHVTIPMLIPSIQFNTILTLIGSFKLFDMIKALTGGGPGASTESISTLMYRIYFFREQAGYACALGVVMFLIIMIVSVLGIMYFRKKEVQV